MAGIHWASLGLCVIYWYASQNDEFFNVCLTSRVSIYKIKTYIFSLNLRCFTKNMAFIILVLQPLSHLKQRPSIFRTSKIFKQSDAVFNISFFVSVCLALMDVTKLWVSALPGLCCSHLQSLVYGAFLPSVLSSGTEKHALFRVRIKWLTWALEKRSFLCRHILLSCFLSMFSVFIHLNSDTLSLFTEQWRCHLQCAALCTTDSK